MFTAAVCFAVLAAVVHVYIFTLESILWTSPGTREKFGLTAEEAETTKELAFNQGFYNLFLAMITAAGAIAVVDGHATIGAALIVAGTAAMALAAIVLAAASPDKAKAALVQGLFPVIALILLGVALTLGSDPPVI